MSGRVPPQRKKSFSYGFGTKVEDALTTKKTKTRRLYGVGPSGVILPSSAAQVINDELASIISYPYRVVFPPEQLHRISSRLVGKYRTSGAINPKRELLLSRLTDMFRIKRTFESNPEQTAELEEEAAQTMLSGGKSSRTRTRPRTRSRTHSHTRSIPSRKSRR
jgi:hypothetical protein